MHEEHAGGLFRAEGRGISTVILIVGRLGRSFTSPTCVVIRVSSTSAGFCACAGP